jgi:hypothetical protein
LLAVLLAFAISTPAYAGRNFDGANDEIEMGSDASIDAFVARTHCAWVRGDGTGVTDMIATKGVTGILEAFVFNTTDTIRYVSDWTTDGNWNGTTDVADGATFNHLCVTYSNSGTTNDAVLLVNCVSEALTTDTAPTGSVVSDAGNNLQLGESNDDANDFDGIIAYYTYDNISYNGGQCNLARWQGVLSWGTVEVIYDFETSKVVNEGTATAAATATGTTVVPAAVPVERRYSGMMGVGR